MATEEKSATLFILGLEKSDCGEYTCKAVNQVGTVTCNALVTLRG